MGKVGINGMGKYIHLADLLTFFQIENFTRASETMPSQSTLGWNKFYYMKKTH